MKRLLITALVLASSQVAGADTTLNDIVKCKGSSNDALFAAALHANLSPQRSVPITEVSGGVIGVSGESQVTASGFFGAVRSGGSDIVRLFYKTDWFLERSEKEVGQLNRVELDLSKKTLSIYLTDEGFNDDAPASTKNTKLFGAAKDCKIDRKKLDQVIQALNDSEEYFTSQRE